MPEQPMRRSTRGEAPRKFSNKPKKNPLFGTKCPGCGRKWGEWDVGKGACFNQDCNYPLPADETKEDG